LGNVQSYNDGENHTWTYLWDNHGNLLSESTPLVNVDGVTRPIVTTYDYEATIYNRLKTINFDDNTHKQHFTWTVSDLLDSFTDELGRTTEYKYDPLDRLTRTILPQPDSSSSSPEYNTFYGNNLLVEKEVDALGNEN